jgi:hypothetical protein
MKQSKSITLLVAALACGIHPAFADEPEDILKPAPVPTVLRLPAPPPPLDQIIPAPPPLVEDILLAPPRLLEQIKGHVRYLVAQAAPEPAPAPPATPAKAAKPRPPEAGPFGIAMGAGSRASRSLIIPKDDMDPQAMAAAEEDLNVMAVILNEAVDEKPDDDRKVMGIDIFGGFSSGARNILIEGYGAIFMLKTRLSLTPPPDRKEESKSKESTSSEWEEARRRLYGTAEWEREIHKSLKHLPGGSPAPYDEDKVNELKNDLIDSLKNATNIRGLKGDNLVTVVITGPSFDGGRDSFAVRLDSIVRRAAGEVHRVEHEERSGDGRRGSIMIQAKKSDIDDFAKNGNKEAFRKKVKVRVY